MVLSVVAGIRTLVRVHQGILKGKVMTSVRDQRRFVAFLGVPYAQPPLAELRFKAPQSPSPWRGVLDATAERNVCPQNLTSPPGVYGDEDCLFLNVYTPEIPNSPQKPLKAVMVWIHGGAFFYGSGGLDSYGPDYLVEEGVLVVTMNYRLGALGFMSLQDAEIPGNAGMKDQVAALRWVRQNIAVFGGDPNKVTIFGQSAGGASVHYHMLSPSTQGLFRRAVAQSGTALAPWALNERPRHMALRLIDMLGCRATHYHEMLLCLQETPVEDIVQQQEVLLAHESKRRGDTIPFAPSVELEPEEDDPETYLTATPQQLMQSGRIHRVPFITGVTSDEGMFALLGHSNVSRMLSRLDRDFQSVVPADLRLERNTAQSRSVAALIRSAYFGARPVHMETLGSFIDLKTDVLFAKDVLNTVRRHAFFAHSPVYMYQFSFDGRLGLYKKRIGYSHLPGVCHADDLGYLFHIPAANLSLGARSPETITRDRMVRMWTNFAKTGEPTPHEDSLLDGVDWLPYTMDSRNYLSVDSELTIKQDLSKDRMAFWDSLYLTVQ